MKCLQAYCAVGKPFLRACGKPELADPPHDLDQPRPSSRKVIRYRRSPILYIHDGYWDTRGILTNINHEKKSEGGMVLFGGDTVVHPGTAAYLRVPHRTHKS